MVNDREASDANQRWFEQLSKSSTMSVGIYDPSDNYAAAYIKALSSMNKYAIDITIKIKYLLNDHNLDEVGQLYFSVQNEYSMLYDKLLNTGFSMAKAKREELLNYHRECFSK